MLGTFGQGALSINYEGGEIRATDHHHRHGARRPGSSRRGLRRCHTSNTYTARVQFQPEGPWNGKEPRCDGIHGDADRGKCDDRRCARRR